MQEQIENLKEKLKEANLLLKEKDDKLNKKIESNEKKDDEVNKIQEKYDKYDLVVFDFLNLIPFD